MKSRVSQFEKRYEKVLTDVCTTTQLSRAKEMLTVLRGEEKYIMACALDDIINAKQSEAPARHRVIALWVLYALLGGDNGTEVAQAAGIMIKETIKEDYTRPALTRVFPTMKQTSFTHLFRIRYTPQLSYLFSGILFFSSWENQDEFVSNIVDLATLAEYYPVLQIAHELLTGQRGIKNSLVQLPALHFIAHTTNIQVTAALGKPKQYFESQTISQDKLKELLADAKRFGAEVKVAEQCNQLGIQKKELLLDTEDYLADYTKSEFRTKAFARFTKYYNRFLITTE